MGNKSFSSFYDIYMEVTDFVILNLLWVGCTLLGGVIFGWAPSTVALLKVMRDKIRNLGKARIARDFWNTYRSEFKNANYIGMILTVIFIMSYINNLNFTAQPEKIFHFFAFLAKFSMFFVFGIALYVFPLYVHYDIKLKEYIPKAITFLVCRPFVTICLALWCWLIFSGICLIPGTIPVLAISLFAYGVMAITYQFFMRNEDRLKASAKAQSE